MLDSGEDTPSYQAALQTQRDKISNPALTPSARIVEEMRTTEESFFDFARRMSQGHRNYFHDLAIAPEIEKKFRAEAVKSAERQAEIEKADDISFDEYLRRYYQD
jgi:glutamate--cysteine ligase